MPTAKITVNHNGPLRIEGDFVIAGAAGKRFGLAGRAAVTLCRRGHSENKPFRDGSHSRQGFQSVCEARDLPAPLKKA